MRDLLFIVWSLVVCAFIVAYFTYKVGQSDEKDTRK